jgi:CubicO group peptidase (beta-lactamase class C family)
VTAWGEHIDDALAAWVRPGGPGLAVLVAVDGRTVYARGHGLADRDRAVPVTPQTLFELASVSKQFTGLAVLLSAERGRLGLDDDVRAHVPELSPWPGPRPIRLTDLVWHTSGLPDYLDLGVDLAGFGNPDVAALLSGRALEFAPGSGHRYCNSNYVLLALAVERAWGVSFARFLREHVFAPLGMNATLVCDDPALPPGCARGYECIDGAFQPCEHPNRITGDGNVWSNLDDLALWSAALAGRPAALLGSPAWTRMLGRGRLDDGTELDYGFGIRLEQFRDRPLVGHGGGWGGYRTYLGLYDGGRLAVVVLGNDRSLGARDMADVLAAACLDLLMPPSAQRPAAPLPQERPR